MELWKEILAEVLSEEQAQVTFPNLTISAAEIVEGACYRALNNIKTILENEELSDPECFLKIEQIIRTLESLGSNCGSRHDF